MANGRAIASDGTDGFVKVVAEKETDRILGVQIISKGGSEMIASAVAHMEYGGSAEDLGRTVHQRGRTRRGRQRDSRSIAGTDSPKRAPRDPRVAAAFPHAAAH